MKPIILLIYLYKAFYFTLHAQRQKNQTTRTTDIYGAGVIHLPVVADLDVDGAKVISKVSGTGTVVAFKRDAISNATELSNADVIAQPTFKITTSGTRTTAEVEGYPAKYSNFRHLSVEEIPLIEAGVWQRPAENEEPVQIKKKRGAGVAILSTILLVGTAVGLTLAFQ